MSSTNQSPEYKKAQGRFLEAKTIEEKIDALEEMIRECPKHKSSEKMLANLTTRRKKLEQDIKKKKKSGKSSFKGIKKEDMQALIIGKTNSGKSMLLKTLTNATPLISNNKFTTKTSIIGMMPYLDTQIQLIEIPAIESEGFDKSLVHTADLVLILITNLEDLKYIQENLPSTNAKRIIVFNKSDLLSEQEKRKISATLQSKKYNYILISSIQEIEDNNLEELKKKIFDSFNILKVYTKEPGKEKSKKPMIMKPKSTVRDIAEKILKGLSKNVKETKIWGPSSKFGGQKVGLNHQLRNLDVVELKTK